MTIEDAKDILNSLADDYGCGENTRNAIERLIIAVDAAQDLLEPFNSHEDGEAHLGIAIRRPLDDVEELLPLIF